VITLAEKLPEASLRTKVDAVLLAVAEEVAETLVAMLDAEAPPTEFTVAAADPGPDAETSPVKAVIDVPPALICA
jgi:hypothetical protein